MQLELATVIDNVDPEKNCRVKVAIPGKFPEDNPENCPWVRCTSDKASSSSYYDVDIPIIGTVCLVAFVNNDINTGFIVKYIPIPGQELLENYPNINGSISRNGNLFLNNSQTGDTIFQHQSGSKVTFKADGDIVFESAKNIIFSSQIIINNSNKISITTKNYINNSDSYSCTANSISCSCNSYNIVGTNTKIAGDNITIDGKIYNSYGTGVVHGMTIASYTCPMGGWTAWAGSAAPIAGGGGTGSKPLNPIIVEVNPRVRPDGENNA